MLNVSSSNAFNSSKSHLPEKHKSLFKQDAVHAELWGKWSRLSRHSESEMDVD